MPVASQKSNDIRAYCSWCFRRTRHRIVQTSAVFRTEHRCVSCGKRTYKCRFCANMARGAGDELPEGIFKRLQASWSDELCAEHDGTVASFENLSHRLNDLADYRVL